MDWQHELHRFGPGVNRLAQEPLDNLQQAIIHRGIIAKHVDEHFLLLEASLEIPVCLAVHIGQECRSHHLIMTNLESILRLKRINDRLVLHRLLN